MEEKNNLADSFYEQDGSFIPRTGSSGNTDPELAHIRNTYMEAEREYFLFLSYIPLTYF